MSIDIKSAIMKKQNDKIAKTKLTLNDVNRQLIIALTALPVYGKEVRDEEILSLIINGGVESDQLKQIKNDFWKKLENKEVKMTKGYYRNKDGFIVMSPIL